MLLVAALFALAQASGGLGPAIIMLSLSVRLALLPLTLHMARRRHEQQTKLLALEPMIHKLRARYRSDPHRLRIEIVRLYRRHGYSPMDMSGLLGGFVQLPIVAGLYAAIKRGLAAGGRFLWISNLAQPDAILALLIGVLIYFATILSPDTPQQVRIITALIFAVLTVCFTWKVASGVGLYWATSTAVGMLESTFLRRKTT